MSMSLSNMQALLHWSHLTFSIPIWSTSVQQLEKMNKFKYSREKTREKSSLFLGKKTTTTSKFYNGSDFRHAWASSKFHPKMSRISTKKHLFFIVQAQNTEGKMISSHKRRLKKLSCSGSDTHKGHQIFLVLDWLNQVSIEKQSS